MSALNFLTGPTLDRNRGDLRDQGGISFPRHTPDTMRRQPGRWTVLLALLASGGFLYLTIFILPDVPRVATGDQSIYLHNAARLYEGQIIYRDFSWFTLPGTDVLYLGLV